MLVSFRLRAEANWSILFGMDKVKRRLGEIFEAYEENHAPLDLFLSRYFRANRYIGASERRELASAVYTIIRWKLLLDASSKGDVSYQTRIETYLASAPFHPEDLYFKGMPRHVAASWPKETYAYLEKQYGEKKAFEIAITMNSRAPTSLRTNCLKITRDRLLQKLAQEGIDARASEIAPQGIILDQRANIMGMDLFKKGFFELQDEASQLVSENVDVRPGMQILDFCAGSGGKSLAIASRMEGKGQLYLHDIRQRILYEARKRLKRAGVQNYQLGLPKKRSMDCVIVDAPCSGSGTWRRQPEQKWRCSKETLDALVKTQREILLEALQYLKPGGTLYYMTCSLFGTENLSQVEWFCNHASFALSQQPFQSIPEPGKMDGLFAARLLQV